VENLTSLMLVKQRLARLGALNLDYGPETKAMPPRFVLRLDQDEMKLDARDVIAWVEKGRGARKLIPDGRLMVTVKKHDDPRELLVMAKELLDDLALFALKARDMAKR
jgi:hypothetical protein